MWELLRFLHLLAMAFFVGGQLMLAAVVVPVLRGGDRAPMRAAARRFGVGTLIALAVLLATGIPLASHEDAWDDGTLHAKLGLVVVAGLLVAGHMRRPQQHAFAAAIFLVSLAILWLGVALAH